MNREPASGLFIDVSHTCHTRARTGVQRVVRSLLAALGPHAVAVAHDPYLGAWRELKGWERTNLSEPSPGSKRGAQWPLTAKLDGRLRRLFRASRREVKLGTAAGTIVPEIFSPAVAATLRDLPRPRVAVFHDAIPLQLPEYTPQKTVARFPAYLRELLEFDGIAAVSEDSREALIEYWRWLGVANPPVVRTIPLGIDIPGADGGRVPRPVGRAGDSARRLGSSSNRGAERSPRPTTPLDDRRCGTTSETPPASAPMAADTASWPIVLCVGSIEGRKNHLALFDACEQLWARGREFELHVVGLPRAETAAPALARMRELQSKGRPLRHSGAADDLALDAAYAACQFTVYPSLMEGFGLPVLESLAHGKPCICSQHGALGESARDGGCLMLASVDAASLAEGMDRLLTDPAEHARLTAEARRRTFRTWREYARDLTAWVDELRKSDR